MSYTAMKPTTKLLGLTAFGLAVLIPLARAQTSTSDAPPPGPNAGVAGSATAPSQAAPNDDAWLLGRSYVEIYGGIDKFLHTENASTGEVPGLGFNVPVSDYVEVGGLYDYEHAANTTFKLNDNSFYSAVTAFDKIGGAFAPFVSAGLGYDLRRYLYQGKFTRTDSLYYYTAFGFEVPVASNTALRADVNHEWDFTHPHPNSWNYGLSANAWINPTVGTFVGADWKNGYGGDRSSVFFSAGLRISFDAE